MGQKEIEEKGSFSFLVSIITMMQMMIFTSRKFKVLVSVDFSIVNFMFYVVS